MKHLTAFFKRIRYSAIPCFLLVFMYTFYLPIETVTANATSISFTYHDILVELVIICLGILTETKVIRRDCIMVRIIEPKSTKILH